MGLLDMSPDEYVKQATQYGFGDYVMGRPMKSQAEALAEWQKLQTNNLAMEEARTNLLKQQQAQERQNALQQGAMQLYKQMNTPFVPSSRIAEPGLQQMERDLGAKAPSFTPDWSPPSEVEQYKRLGQYYAGQGDVNTADKIMDTLNKGREKVKDWKETIGPDGRPVMSAMGEYGTVTGTSAMPWKAPEKMDLGGSVQMYDPVTGAITGKFGKSMTPGESASNAVAWANNALGQQRLAFDKTQAGPAGTNKAPAGYRWKPDGSLEPIPGGPQDLKAGSQSAKQADAKDVLSLLDMAEPLVKKATGSYAGAGADMAANVFGFSTEGANAASQLQALEGMLVSKMPKMSGPQSDKDVLLYKQMAGQIGDPTVPATRKQAAMQTIRQINERYAGIEPKQQTSNAPRSKFFNVGGKQMAGQLGADGNYYVTKNGKRYRIEE